MANDRDVVPFEDPAQRKRREKEKQEQDELYRREFPNVSDWFIDFVATANNRGARYRYENKHRFPDNLMSACIPFSMSGRWSMTWMLIEFADKTPATKEIYDGVEAQREQRAKEIDEKYKDALEDLDRKIEERKRERKISDPYDMPQIPAKLPSQELHAFFPDANQELVAFVKDTVDKIEISEYANQGNIPADEFLAALAMFIGSRRTIINLFRRDTAHNVRAKVLFEPFFEEHEAYLECIVDHLETLMRQVDLTG